LKKYDNQSPTLTASKSQVSRLVGNTASMLSSDTITRLGTFLLYVLVGRYLGTQSFGRMSLALTLLAAFQVFASGGLRMLIIREVASDRSKTNSYLINGSFVVTILSLISLAALLLLNILFNYSSATSEIIMLFGLGLLPFSLSTVCEAVFQAWERMEYIVLVNLPRNLLVVGFTFWLLLTGYGLKAIGILLLISYFLMLGMEWWIILRYISRPKIKPSLETSAAMIRASFPIMSFQAIFAITGSLIYVILSIIMSETEVGLFNAATQVITPAVVIYESIIIAAYPMLCQSFTISLPALKRMSDQLVELVLSIALPATIGLFVLGEKVLLLMYSNREFARARDILRIMSASLIMSALSGVFGRVLLASFREKTLLHIVSIRSLANIIFSLFFIKAFGLLGAAISFLLISVLDTTLHFYQVSRLYPKLIPWQRLWRTTLATVGMTIYLLVKPELGVVIDVLVGGAIYAVLWLVLSVWSAGNVRQFKAKYLGPWST
jgi:O-antigen/teichoic acid export membrane protein